MVRDINGMIGIRWDGERKGKEWNGGGGGRNKEEGGNEMDRQEGRKEWNGAAAGQWRSYGMVRERKGMGRGVKGWMEQKRTGKE